MNANEEGKFNEFLDAGNQFYVEVKQLIKRYDRESDITCFQIIGALESAKMDIQEDMRKERNEPT